MFIFRESGRLGNQIFQYAALKTLSDSTEPIVLLGFEELQEAFEGISAKIINKHSPKVERFLYHRFFDFLSNNDWFTRIQEEQDSKHLKIICHSGIIRRFKVVRESYFQSELLFSPDSISSLSIHPKKIKRAKDILKGVVKGKIPVFIHVRRGDYAFWPSKTAPAILPAAYYRRCVDIIRSRLHNVFFIFTSDDFFYVKDVFGDLTDSYISQGDSSEDFALMTQCHSGILSASSFSWWAAYLSSTKDRTSIFLAPKYWAGHRQKSWYPNSIQSSFLEYVDV